MRPIILTVAGSDSSGGAGIQADLKAIEANRGYAASALTAITAQNTCEVRRSFVLPPDLIRDQIDAVFDDLDVAAVKTGMLADSVTIDAVADALERHRPRHYVLDPVMISKSGFALLDPRACERLARRLLPLATLVTPNVHEAGRLAGIEFDDADGAARAGEAILALGARAVLVKGGHLSRAPATDVLVGPGFRREFPGPYLDTRHTHGTGCTYSAAIATWLGRGADLETAVQRAKVFVTEAIRHGRAIGRGHGPTDPFHFLDAEPPARGLGPR